MFFDKIKHKVQIIAPSSPPATEDETNNIIKHAITLFDHHNIRIVISNDLCKPTELPYYANTVKFRVKDLKDALSDEEVKIIWAFRGGYSSIEVAEHIDVIPSSPKLLIGFSDITVLHMLFNQKFNMPTIHGETISRLTRIDGSSYLDQIFNILENKKPIIYPITPVNQIFKKKLSGKLLGGNLKMISTMIGTFLHPKLDNCILFIEDVNEKGYAIMRDLVHLRQAGLLSDVKGIIFGDFIGGNETNGSNYVETTIEYFANNINIPCFRIKDVGHGKINNPIILGTNCIIDDNKLEIINPF